MPRLAWIPLLLTLLATPALAEATPAPLDEVVSDYADVLDAPTEAAIDALGEALWTEHSVPLVVVVLPKMAQYDELPQVDFVPFTTAWVLDWEFDSQAISDRAVYLFVSTGDRTARIALGNGYADVKELDIQMILVDHLVPHLKKDDWNTGIAETATALADLVRKHAPAPLSAADAAVEPQPDSGDAVH